MPQATVEPEFQAEMLPDTDILVRLHFVSKIANSHRTRIVALLAGLFAVGVWIWWQCKKDPSLFYLFQHGDADWIVYPMPPDANLHRSANWNCSFRRTFVLSQAPSSAELTWRAFLHAEVSINGKSATSVILPDTDWKRPRTVDVTTLLRSGTNELSVTVNNSRGPPALWLHLKVNDFQLFSDSQWNASLAGAAWRTAALAGAAHELKPGSPLFPSGDSRSRFVKVWPQLLLLTVVATLLWLVCQRKLRLRRRMATRTVFTPSHLALAGVVSAWLWLAWNNVSALPIVTMGYDTEHHLGYIQFILDHGRIPFADEGFQMFQPPLYYLIAASLVALLDLELASPGTLMMLRLFGLGVGLAHSVCVFLAANLVFRRNSLAGAVAVVVGGLMPMLLYLSFYITNEVLMATFAAGAIVICLRMLRANHFTPGWGIGLGLCLGAAILTKVSALVLLPVITLSLVGRLAAHNQQPLAWFRVIGPMLAACFIVSGWYYLMVWQRFGSPIVLSWDHVGGSSWWQENGYRTGDFFLRAGGWIKEPFFSGINSFWDGLYSTLWGDGLWSGVSVLDFRPPWNYQLAYVGYLLAVVPTALILFGAVVFLRRWLRRPDAESFLLLGTAAGFLAAMLLVCLEAPFMAAVKAFYGLSSLIPLAVFAAKGWTCIIASNRTIGAVSGTIVLLVGLTSVASLTVRRGDPATEICLALHASASGQSMTALQLTEAAVARHPTNARLVLLNAQLLEDAGRRSEALAWTSRAAGLATNDSLYLLLQAEVARVAGERAQAVSMLHQAIQLSPHFTPAYEKLALILAENVQFAEALDLTRAGLATAPTSRALHVIAGSICLSMGRHVEAEQHLRLALDFGEDTLTTRFLIAVALMELDQPQEAVEHLLLVLRLQPNHSEALGLLGAARSQLGAFVEAAVNLEAAVKLTPDSPVLLNNLAWLRATCPDAAVRNGGEALRLAFEACRLTEESEPQLLGTLAAAYAESGRFTDAISTCQRAIALAEAATNQMVANRNRELLRLYADGKPYRESAK